METLPPALPSTMKAFVFRGNQNAGVETVPVPTIDDDEVLVQVVAVGQNPTDWKSIKYFDRHGVISGCDYSGYVVKTGKNVSTLSVGDDVAGFVMGATFKDRGAFAEYLKVAADLTWKVPQGTLSHEEAATMGCALWTAVQALFHPKRLGLVEPPAKVDRKEWVFVYGGSSSVGMFAVQLAHAAGYRVAATSSPNNFDLVKSLGADVVFNYKDPDYIAKIKESTEDSVHYALDAISLPQTQKDTVKILGPGSGKVLTVLPIDEEAKALRADVTVDLTLVYTTHGLPFNFREHHFQVVGEDRAHAANFIGNKLSDLVKSGQLKPNPVKLFPGGLEGISAGLKYMEEGNVSGYKIVYRLSEPVL